MICPKCEREMQFGTADFVSVQGFPQMTCMFVSAEEKKKGLFKRERKSKLITGEEAEAFYCAECDLIVPILK